MKDRFVEDVYDTLRGVMILQGRIDGVENAFAPGGACDRLYAQMLDAYERLRNRLGVVDEDADVEIIISSLMRIEREISHRMYAYGAKFGMEIK